MSSEGRRWTIAVDLDWPDSAVVVDEDSPRRQGFVYYEVEPVGESASEVERLRERCGRVEALLTDVLAILPYELAWRVEARMPAINPDEREERE